MISFRENKEGALLNADKLACEGCIVFGYDASILKGLTTTRTLLMSGVTTFIVRPGGPDEGHIDIVTVNLVGEFPREGLE